MRKFIILYLFFQIFNPVSKAQNVYLFHNKFYNSRFDTLYKVKGDSVSTTSKKIHSSLKGYINKLSDDKDTMFIKFWYISDTAYTRKFWRPTNDTGYRRVCKFKWIKKIPDPYKDSTKFINSKDNNATFAYVINWDNKRYISVPFSANVLVATTIPFRYRLKSNSDLEADFLNVGVNAFRIWGKTKFYQQEQIDPRYNYKGLGIFAGFSQQKIDSSNTNRNVKQEKQVAVISYGFSGIVSWNGFSVILALGFDNSIGKNAKYWEENNFRSGLKPWIGFGFGIKLTELRVNATNKQKTE